ncbi:histidine--tRNA ligase [Parvibium lacunae]|uniref:Histidine--tRNA ligase n=1 Tax=Parvibium lacunae TaxID=1888893 RepID=A0A368L8G5_9BURK|nr:histidine--tRNA ligase [Parvibium lacunae]RCS59955.1 histidine--tRNA ligase [Parvibium lacunae]
MNDILPVQAAAWEGLEETLRVWLHSYGYRNMRTPVLEHTALFARGIGEVTDIVEKEMFCFTDRLNGDELTLRPEFTAGVVRAVAEHNLLEFRGEQFSQPQRLYSYGPVFRHERPQKGRYRQFHQLSVEAIGFAGPDVDAEIIVMLARLWEELGLSQIRLELNCLGDLAERQAHREALITYFTAHADQLDADAQRRLHSNPLRILDSKNPALQSLLEAAPRLSDFLGPASLAHFQTLQRYLKQAGIAYTLNPRLVRGLDYYNLTVFEWVTDQLGAQGTVCGGGRYDGLMATLAGKQAPAIGFGIGIERLLLLLESIGGIEPSAGCDLYIVHQASDAYQAEVALRAFAVAEELRGLGFAVVLHCGGGNFKAQMKKADASGAHYALIIGDNEWLSETVTLKSLRAGGSAADNGVQSDGRPVQQTVALAELARVLSEQLYDQPD